MLPITRAAVALALIACSAGASAQSAAAAETLFREARADMKANRIAEACQKFAESQRLDPSVGTLLNLATCEDKLGKIASAWARFSEVVDLAPRGDTRARTASERRDALAPRLPKVRLTGTLPPKTLVELDGIALTSIGVLMPVDPGPHALRLRRGSEEKTIKFEAKESQAIDLPLPALEERAVEPVPVASAAPLPSASASPPAAPPVPPPSTEPPAARGSRTPGYVLAGVGGVAAVVGLTAGALALGKKSTVADHCVGGVCDAEGADAGRAGRRYVTVANVSLALGAVALGVGGWWLATTPATARSGEFHVGYSGRFH